MKAAAQFSFFCFLLAALVSAAATRRRAGPDGPRPACGVNGRPRPARPASVPGTVVAVVDVSYVFENHSGFKDAMDRMKQEVQQYEEELRTRHQALSKERDQMMQFTPGSPDYERMERALTDKAAKLQVDTQLKKKEFLQRESKVYYEVYQDVSNAVREFAEMKGIDLVLRYNGAEMKADDRASVLQGVNRAMVYQRNLDITREILDRLNRAPRTAATNDPRVYAAAARVARPFVRTASEPQLTLSSAACAGSLCTQAPPLPPLGYSQPCTDRHVNNRRSPSLSVWTALASGADKTSRWSFAPRRSTAGSYLSATISIPSCRFPLRYATESNRHGGPRYHTAASRSKWSSTSWPRWRACRIDNCEIWTNAAEMPGMDGSSWPFAEALESAGIVAAGGVPPLSGRQRSDTRRRRRMLDRSASDA